MRIIKTVLITLITVLIAIPAFAGDWEASISVSVQNAGNQISFGEKAGATDGIDSRYDVPAMLAGDVKAYFLCEGQSLWRDIKALTPGTKVWDLRVESGLNGRDAILKWDSNKLPDGEEIVLKDLETGKIVDMKKQNTWTYKNTGSREFRIEAGD